MIEVVEVDQHSLVEYARIPMRYTVNSVFQVDRTPNGTFALSEYPVDAPYHKDYGALRDQNPTAWPIDFDVSNWGFFFAYVNGEIAGAAAVAANTRTTRMLDGRSDRAVLRDIRVHTSAQRIGIGNALIRAVEDWARERNCVEMKIETQNNNVPACRFYERHGYALREVHYDAYPDFPNEVQLLWYKRLHRT